MRSVKNSTKSLSATIPRSFPCRATRSRFKPQRLIIDIDAPCKSVTAVNGNGAIKVRGTKGPLDLNSTFGVLDIDVKADEAGAVAERACVVRDVLRVSCRAVV